MLNNKLLSVFALTCLTFVASCGKIKDKVDEVSNSQKVQGHWLQTESENAGAIQKTLENESIVLSFKDDRAAFAPTDSTKGQLVYATLSHCLAGPRSFRTDGNQLVFPAEGDCPEKRVDIQQLDDNSLKFPDPENPKTVRTFIKIDNAAYSKKVKAADRRL